MSLSHRGLFMGAIAAAALLLSTTASAKPGAQVEEKEEGYAYHFNDDPLTANSSAATAARIRVAPRGMRRTLIRPRLHFIPELLKSVENL
jgi:ABC-type oligopeptide transport system substrate-binding subunit